MDLSIIIVSWNVKDKLRENLSALFKSRTDFSFEVFIVDNASNDGSVEMVENNFPQVKLVRNNVNLGFACANNQAFIKSQGEFILLLNPDMRVEPGTIDNIIHWVKNNQQASVTGCQLIDERGCNIPHTRRFPEFFDQLAIILKLPHLFPGILNRYLNKDFNYSRESKVDSIRGSFFLIRRSSFEKYFSKERVKKGELLDERYFIWFEEVDFCKELKEAGGQVWYTPVAVAIDHIGQSFSQIKSPKKQKYFRDSMIKYFKKWHNPIQALILDIFWPVGILIAKMIRLMTGDRNK